MASASVGSPMAACQWSTGSWLATRVARRPCRSSSSSSKSRRCSSVKETAPKTWVLLGLAWVEIKSSAVEVDRRLEVFDVAEAAGHTLDLLDLAVEPLAHRVGDRMLVVGEDILDVPTDRLRCLANWFQPAVRCPEVPPLPELPA